jgi:hypothetical protein
VTTLTAFLDAVAQDPILVDDFVADPDRVMDQYGIPESLRTLLKSRDDVAILSSVLRERAASRETG